jgi:formylglycine-generating enzyme required for sulfatase activity
MAADRSGLEAPEGTALPEALAVRFGTLLRTLRSRYQADPQSCAAAFGILVDEVARSGKDLKRLRYRLTPIFATDPESQADIGRLVDLFVQAAPERTPLEQAVKTDGAARRKTRVRLRKAALIALILANAGLALWWFWPWQEPDPVRPEPPEPVATGTPDPPTPIPLADGVTIDPVTELLIGDPVVHPARPWVILAATLGPLAVAAAWIAYRRNRRSKIIRAAGRRSVEPDGRMAESFAAQGIPLTDVVGEAAGRLGAAGQIRDRDLDPIATVQATVRAAGFFSPVHRRAAGAADYVVLIERRAPNDHLARIIDDVLDRIAAAGVSLRRLYYADDPRHAIEAGRTRPIESLATLIDSLDVHRFLVVGSSDGFFHPLTGELLDWARAFDTLTSRALLDARPVGHWGWREEELIATGFSIGEASPDGIAQYARAVAAGEDLGGGRLLDGRRKPESERAAEWALASSTRAPFERFRDHVPGIPTPEMVVLPGGTFVMGSPPEEEGRFKSEGPQRKVHVTGFALARTPLTFEEFDAFCSATGRSTPDDRGFGRGRRPVINVSWEDAQAYLGWLNGLIAGRPYRLPSEAEWEYACRAGTTTPVAFDDTNITQKGRYLPLFAEKETSKERSTHGTTPVDDLDAENVWGLRHMHGNVWEWVEDCWHENYEGAPEDGRAWRSENGGDCSSRVVRGGSWANDPRTHRSACRVWKEPDYRSKAFGFRPARTLTP